MKITITTVAAVVAALTVGAIAVAQTGIVGSSPSEECADVDKRGGAFGECVSERASAYGRCVSAADQRDDPDPEASCAELKREDEEGNGRSGAGDRRDGTEDRNPTSGLERPPAVDGRDFGRQVSERARGNAGPPEDAGPPPGAGPPQGAGPNGR